MALLFSNSWQISKIFYIKNFLYKTILEKSDERNGTHSTVVFPHLLKILIFTSL